MGERCMWMVLVALLGGLPLAALAGDPAVKPPEEPPVQQPADPGAVGKQMSDMQAAADALITEAEAELAKGETPAAELFVAYEGRIHLAMWPAFGPANAWLFNERAGKIGQLAGALGVAGEERVPFEIYARVILSALAGGADLQPFVESEAGLDVGEAERTDGGGRARGWSGPLRGDGLRTDARLGRVRGLLREAIGAGVVPQIDAAHKRVRVRHEGQTVELVLQWFDRWVLAEVSVRP